MALKQLRLGGSPNVLQYDDADFPEAIETTEPIACGSAVDPDHAIILGDLPASIFAGTTGSFTHISSIQAGGGGALGIQYKTQQITMTDGIVTAIGAESAWIDI